VDDTSTADACDELPENDAPSVELRVKPADIVANPAKDAGVKVSLDNTATLVLPAYIDDITFDEPTLSFIVSIFHPESVWPEVYTGPTNNHADPV
jgi:hypothetical protein